MAEAKTEPQTEPAAEPRGPSFTVKLIVSGLIVFHLGCILINVAAAGTGAYQAPRVIQKIYSLGGIVRTWLGSIFQTNAYRFYAPDPGPCDLLWVRFKYADPADPQKEIVATRWHETPNREEHSLRMPYQRDLAICMLLNMHVEPMQNPAVPAATGIHFNEVGQICFASYMRHLAAQPRFAQLTSPEQKKPLVLVGMDAFKVAHRILAPMDVQSGLTYMDPRLYEVYFLGRFDVNGKRVDGADEPFVPQDVADLAARMVQDDLWPAAAAKKLKPDDLAGLKALIREMGVPKPFRAALEQDPGFMNIGQNRSMLARRFVDQTSRGDRVEVMRKWGMLPQGTLPTLTLPQPSGGLRPDQSLQNRIAPRNANPPASSVR